MHPGRIVAMALKAAASILEEVIRRRKSGRPKMKMVQIHRSW